MNYYGLWTVAPDTEYLYSVLQLPLNTIPLISICHSRNYVLTM